MNMSRTCISHPSFSCKAFALRTCSISRRNQTRSLVSIQGPRYERRNIRKLKSTKLRRGTGHLLVAAAASEETVDVRKSFLRLQNGSDIRGVALEGIKGQPVNLTEGRAFYIGAAFAEWLFENVTGGRPELDQEEEDGSARVSIGMDPRLSGGELAGGLTAGLFSRGVQVTLFGLATTPAMFMSTITPTYEFSGAIMITASHLPFNRNGMKFFTSEGGLEKKNISDILERAAKLCLQAGGEPDSMDAAMDFFCGKDSVAEYTQVNFMRVYADQLRNIIKMGVKHPDSYDTPLEGFRIVVDAGNGSGGFFAEEVLKPLGANITGSKFLEPDGSFPNHIPNPEEAEAMESTTEAVVNSGADLGICFDTDVDRSGVVDETGRQINSNKYIALMAAITLEDFPGTTIVTDSVTSNGLTKFITDLGGKHFRYRRGYKNVIAKGVELNEAGESCELMMETSGHGAMKENFFLDDGAYSAVKVIIEMVRRRISGRGTISQLLESLAEPVESREFRLKIQDEDFQSAGKKVLDDFHEYVASGEVPNWKMEEVNHEGWRVVVDEGDGKKGWLLLRQSLHDPLLVLNVESEVECGATVTAFKMNEFMASRGYDNVDFSALTVDEDCCIKSGGWDGLP
uniref:phosphoglucomutase (alpha-D-glucose-1,6-bisphosphate-dependent) n=1 Tax=Tetraselmis sp. GSL018 TaxID=582737 RepID=A0A061R0N2_9CHLO|mmetsp:Transcript_42623/g.101206  ORF Transcript_42623/g.101206 Transcript_42623/m.101206 type:complete len:627 (+) Transcript_42623:114-1994(+)